MNGSDTPSTERGTGCLPAPLITLVRWIDRLNGFVGRGVSWMTFLLVVVTVADVILRYVFRTSFVAIQELEWHLFAIIFLMDNLHFVAL